MSLPVAESSTPSPEAGVGPLDPETVPLADSPTQKSPWLLLLLFLPILVMGLLSLWQFLVQLVRGEAGVVELLPYLGVGVLFTALGGGVYYSTFVADRFRALQAARIRALHPGEPWRWPLEWRNGVIEYSDRGSRNFLWFFGLAWLGILLGVVVDRGPLLWQERAWAPMILVAVFLLIGIFTVEQAILATRRARRYGRSRLELVSFPARLGDRFEARLHTGMRATPPRALKARLSCERRHRVFVQEGATAADRKADERTETLWEKQWKLPPDALLPGPLGLSAAISTELPADAPATHRDDPLDRIEWRLEVRAPGAAAAYRSEFTVPVFGPSIRTGE